MLPPGAGRLALRRLPAGKIRDKDRRLRIAGEVEGAGWRMAGKSRKELCPMDAKRLAAVVSAPLVLLTMFPVYGFLTARSTLGRASSSLRPA